jgi:hypothetical protein
MARSQWHKFYTASVKAPADVLFRLLSDLPNYGDWLPGSREFGQTAGVDPYPVRFGSRYHDGKPDGPGRDWWGTVTGFQPPGSLDFRQTIEVRQVLATVDVNIHYSLEDQGDATLVTRWLVLDVRMPIMLRPLRPAVVSSFDKENARTMAALKAYAEAEPDMRLCASRNREVPDLRQLSPLSYDQRGSSLPSGTGTPWGNTGVVHGEASCRPARVIRVNRLSRLTARPASPVAWLATLAGQPAAPAIRAGG